MSVRWTSFLLSVAILGVAPALPAVAAEELNIYSARKEALIKPLLDRFTEQTGIAVNLVTGGADELIKRLETEGRNTPADLLVTVDAGRLHRAKRLGLIQRIESDILSSAIPAAFRDPDGYWWGLSLRARTVMYARDRVNADDLNTYESLADPRWRGRICVRSSDNIYNQSLVASLIATLGVEETEKWARGLVANMARPPRGGDRDQIKAAAAGICDLVLANTYYLAQMIHSEGSAQRDAAEKMGVFWPNQNGRGAHVNVSGAAVTRYARNREQAVRLLEFLLADGSQRWYADVNYEYPVKPGIAWNETLNEWGRFKADTLNLDRLGELNAEALRVMDRAGWK